MKIIVIPAPVAGTVWAWTNLQYTTGARVLAAGTAGTVWGWYGPPPPAPPPAPPKDNGGPP